MKTVRYEAGTHTLILPSDIHVAPQSRFFVECDTIGGAITINLPNIIGVKWFNFDIVVSHVSEANAGITINAASGQTINGASSLSLSAVGATGKLIVANNLEWSFLDESGGSGGGNSKYVQFSAILNQSGGNDPDVFLVDSTFTMDDVYIGIQATGRYYVYSEKGFPFRRTHVLLGNSTGSQIANESITKNCPNQFVIRTENSSGTLGNGRLIDTAIDIKVNKSPNFIASSGWIETSLYSVDTDMDSSQFSDIKFPISEFEAVMDEKKLLGGQKVEIENYGIFPLKYSYKIVADGIHIAIDELVDFTGTINVRFLAEGFY
jgi:hypothetical protein